MQAASPPRLCTSYADCDGEVAVGDNDDQLQRDVADLNAGVGVGRELQAGQLLLRKGGPRSPRYGGARGWSSSIRRCNRCSPTWASTD